MRFTCWPAAILVCLCLRGLLPADGPATILPYDCWWYFVAPCDHRGLYRCWCRNDYQRKKCPILLGVGSGPWYTCFKAGTCCCPSNGPGPAVAIPQTLPGDVNSGRTQKETLPAPRPLGAVLSSPSTTP
jgi:ABC-type Co2+ transport system permease subunit